MGHRVAVRGGVFGCWFCSFLGEIDMIRESGQRVRGYEVERDKWGRYG